MDECAQSISAIGVCLGGRGQAVRGVYRFGRERKGFGVRCEDRVRVRTCMDCFIEMEVKVSKIT